MPAPRNKKIADFFKDLGLIEKYGSGIQRIIGHFKNENRPLPEFKNISDGFQVTVFSADIRNATETVEKSSEKIISIIKGNPLITIEELSVLLNKTTRAIEKNHSKLKTLGLIERIGPDKGGRWKVLDAHVP